jgi:DNA-binding MarR family transcriptional regulator/AcrR family transcriptional regulator
MSHAIFRVARAHKAIAGRLLREAGLYPGQELVLMALWTRGPQRMIDLATAVESDAPSLTRSVARLEKAGLVTRTPSPSDRRVMIVAPTEASLAFRAKVEDAWRELEQHTSGALTAAQRGHALANLALLEAALPSGTAAPITKDAMPDAPATTPPADEHPRPRKDAAQNAERLVAAAVRAGLGADKSVPMAQIAAEAGVGIGTLYRRYPNREALLEAMEVRAHRILIAEAEDALASAESGLDAIGRYLSQAFDHRDEVVLPLHGAPLPEGTESAALRDRLAGLIAAIVERGHGDGTVRPDVTGWTVIRFGAMLAQPMTTFPGWDEAAAEQRAIFLRGVAPAGR